MEATPVGRDEGGAKFMGKELEQRLKRDQIDSCQVLSEFGRRRGLALRSKLSGHYLNPANWHISRMGLRTF